MRESRSATHINYMQTHLATPVAVGHRSVIVHFVQVDGRPAHTYLSVLSVPVGASVEPLLAEPLEKARRESPHLCDWEVIGWSKNRFGEYPQSPEHRLADPCPPTWAVAKGA